MQKDYRLTQILPGITLLDGFAHECSIYLVAGERRAALIETGMDTWCGQKAVIDKHMLVDAYGDRFKFAVEVRPEAPVDDETAMRMIADAYDEWKGKNVWIIDRACFTPAQKEQMAEYVHARGRL